MIVNLRIKNTKDKYKLGVSLKPSKKLVQERRVLGEQLRYTSMLLGKLDSCHVLDKLVLFDITSKRRVLASERTGQMLGNLLIVETIELSERDMCFVMMSIRNAAIEIGLDCIIPIAA